MPPQLERRAANAPLAQRIQESLTLCWKEGVASQLMVGIIDCYLIPFSLYLGAGMLQIGFLVAIPNLLASISQFFAVRAVDVSGSRLRFLVAGVALQAGFLFPLAFLPFFNIKGRIEVLIVFVCVYRLLGALLGPAWGSLVSEYLPEHRRGYYFGWRSRILGVASILNTAAWGIILYYMKRVSDRGGFVLLFGSAAVFRLVSLYLMSQMVDLPQARTNENDFTFWMFLKRFKESNFVKFVFYVSAIAFATQLAAPYFTVLMLRDLKFDYINYMAISLAPLIMGLVCFPIWGKHADLVGNARILKITGLLIPLPPILWLFTKSVGLLVLIELFSGFVWGGFNLCAANFIYDSVSPGKRVRCLAYFNLINGAALFAGASLGGYLAGRLPPLFGSSLYTLFLLSGLLRFAADFILSRQFTEVRARTSRPSSLQLFFSVVGIRPLIPNEGELAMSIGEPDGFRRRPKES